eukprot:CAMPEP_0119051252 /NCGR_PEP_ID=MMETSP1177-20130426/72929_1 /TAXON_ID=2985 /ORGANISM="Ochromonas sp, Strain CCMP1899" /LENGTH=142 /DNA_ID=CAMNT_0007030391 /DNA_START=67 /DNA_END=492 /DNA_ORIENTATION=+
MTQPTVFATRVVNQAMRLQIPTGLFAGDTFIVTPDNGRVFTVIVPENAIPGSYIEVIVPDEVEPVSHDEGSPPNPTIAVNKTTAGAALAGGVLGTLILGPIGGVVGAMGAAYATTRKEGKIGKYSRIIGESTYTQTSKAKNW